MTSAGPSIIVGGAEDAGKTTVASHIANKRGFQYVGAGFELGLSRYHQQFVVDGVVDPRSIGDIFQTERAHLLWIVRLGRGVELGRQLPDGLVGYLGEAAVNPDTVIGQTVHVVANHSDEVPQLLQRVEFIVDNYIS